MNTNGSAKFRTLRAFALLGVGLAGLYALTYLLLSLCGQYRPMGLGGLSHWQEYSFWVPAGFRLDPEAKRSGPLRLGIMKVFYPLWTADVRWLHNRQDVYMTASRAVTGEWTYKTNSWVRDANRDWILTNFQPATAASK
jgi:hypothetical protein